MQMRKRMGMMTTCTPGMGPRRPSQTAPSEHPSGLAAGRHQAAERCRIVALFFALALQPLCALERMDVPRVESWDYVPAVQAIAAKFTGEAGKVVPMGDSITYANQSGKWARAGVERTADELSLARWMHAELNDRRNGWWLAANDQPDNRSWTAASGITSEEYLKGGFHGLPSLKDILADHKPQIALILLGTNDLKHGIAAEAYVAAMERIMHACMEAGAVPVVTTILPTSWASLDAVAAYNDGLYRMAGRLKLPFLDLHGEFLRLRPGDSWKGSLISDDGAHPTFASSEGPASEDNLKKSGYLAKCVLQCRKVGEIKAKMRW
jgi:lysophospholipase L1-like esterase